MTIRQLSKLFYQIKLVNQETTTKFERQTGISITRYELMMFLKAHGRCSQTTLQNQLHIDSAAVTRHLKVLESKHYVTRERNKDNNREVFVSLTADADKAITDCEANCEMPHQQASLPLTHDEVETLLHLLGKLVK